VFFFFFFKNIVAFPYVITTSAIKPCFARKPSYIYFMNTKLNSRLSIARGDGDEDELVSQITIAVVCTGKDNV